jgi:hypothetical protein
LPRLPVTVLGLVVALAVVACSSATPLGGPMPDRSSTRETPGAGAPADDGAPVFSGGSDAGTTASDCSEESKLVYVVSRENDLYSFAPAEGRFTRIGPLACPSTSNPFSMAVDRAGTAWVLYADGLLFKVSTKDASCATTTYVTGQAGFQLLGMGFAADAPGSTRETLYVSDIGGKGLGKLDPVTLTLTPIGGYDGPLAGRSAELTGTGDGRLYGFFTTAPAQVAQITKGSGAIASAAPMQGVTTGTDWAFSFWGGDFYLYTAQIQTGGLPMDAVGSDVTRYRPSDGSVVVVQKGIGFRIVGAGVSTCAPLVPPTPK